MTLLQKAAQALIKKGYNPSFVLEDEVVKLHKALDDEIAHSVKPVLWITDLDDPIICKTEFETATFCEDDQRPIPLYLHPPQQVVATPLHKLIEGMTVSIDVSTGEYDSGNRLFGVVNEVMESSGDKNGLTLLIYETTPNFKPPQQVAVTSGERAELIADLKREAKRIQNGQIDDWDDLSDALSQAADMLEADAQQAKQVPMSDDQIIATFCTTPDFRQYVSAFKAGVRLAEKYHGIGGEA